MDYKAPLLIFTSLLFFSVDGKLNGPGENICEITTLTSEYIEKQVPSIEWETKIVKHHNCYCWWCDKNFYWKRTRNGWKCVLDVMRITNKTEIVCETVETIKYYCCKGFKEIDGKCVLETMCQINNGGCDQLCRSSHSASYCTCYDGYRLDSTGFKCTDIDECQKNNGGCSDKCQNTLGSYYCECEKGYKLDNYHTCKDIDECHSENGGCQHKCLNKKGSWECKCDDGYELEEYFTCGQISICKNVHGERKCSELCLNATENNDDWHDCPCDKNQYNWAKKTHCKEKNLCSEKNGGCSHICSFENQTITCDCPEGFQNINKTTCKDINECLQNNGNCTHTCVNIQGYYECFCPNGYYLDSDEKTCLSNSNLPRFKKENSDSTQPSIIAAIVCIVLFLCVIIFIALVFLKRIHDRKSLSSDQPIANKNKDLDSAKAFDNHAYARSLNDNLLHPTNAYYSNANPLPSAPKLSLACNNVYDNKEIDHIYSEPISKNYESPPTIPPPRLIEENESKSNACIIPI